jgi:hypothetical protein
MTNAYMITVPPTSAKAIVTPSYPLDCDENDFHSSFENRISQVIIIFNIHKLIVIFI